MPDHTETMVERMARAICKGCGDSPDCTESHPLYGSYWTDDGEPHWNGYVDHARAALTALREPSEGMHDAGNAEMAKDDFSVDVSKIFQAMIDHALKEKG